MNVSVLIATYGAPAWRELACTRAWPSAHRENPHHLLALHDPEGSLASVRNKAAAAVPEENEWLCFLDADDELAPGYLDAMRCAALPPLPTARHREWAWGSPAYGSVLDGRPVAPTLLVPAVQYVDAGGYEARPRVLNDGRPLHEVNNAVIGTLVPRELFLEVGGFPEEPIYEDWACWLACVRAGARLVDVPEAVYRAHVRRDSRNQPARVGREATETYWRIRRAHEAALESVPPGV